MNKPQKYLTGAALALFLASLALAPWASGSRGGHRVTAHGLFCVAPEGTSYLQTGQLITEWLAIGILCGVPWWLCRENP